MTRMIVLATSIASAAFAWLVWSDLPAVVAFHFDAAGRADAFVARTWFLGLGICANAGIPLALWTMHRAAVKRDAVNIPHRDRWLDATHRAATVAFLDVHMAAFILALAAFEGCVARSVALANVAATAMPRLVMGSLWIALAAFMVFAICWNVVLQLRFRRGVPAA